MNKLIERIIINLKHKLNYINLGILYVISIASIIILLYIIIYKYIWSEHYYQNNIKLETQHNLIKAFLLDKNDIGFILSDRSDSTISNQISVFREYIKNHTFVSKYNLMVDGSSNYDLPYISLHEILDIISSQIFKYSISINNELIICNGLIDYTNAITRQYKITKDLFYSISLQVDPDSYYEKQAVYRINNQISFLKRFFITLFLIGITILLYVLNNKQRDKEQIKKLHNNLNNAFIFYKANKDYTFKCHQYFKNIFNLSSINSIENYIVTNCKSYPLSLLITPIKEEKIFITKEKLDLIILNLENYYIGYRSCYNNNVKLEIKNLARELIIPFEQEIFEQIILSILANILFFNKDVEHERYIKIIFNVDRIVFLTDGFRLNRDLMIKYSEKIFDDTGNVYILSLKQVFEVFTSFHIDYVVNRKDTGTEIEIKLSDLHLKINSTNRHQKKIIQFSKFLNKNK